MDFLKCIHTPTHSHTHTDTQKYIHKHSQRTFKRMRASERNREKVEDEEDKMYLQP